MTELAQERLAPQDALKYAANLLVLCVIAVAALTGGMAALVAALAIGLSVHVYQHPEDAIAAGPMFLLACNVFFPSSARFDWQLDAREMVWWAAGLLCITLAAILRIGIRNAFRMPKSLLTFLGVAVLASLYGFVHGNQPSYVLRQLFGILVFVAYFVFGQQFGDERGFLERCRPYAVICAAAFFVYYIAIFGEYGVHKEITTLPTQAAILAILFASFNGWRWKAAAALMAAVPILLVMRHDIVVLLLAGTIGAAIKIKFKSLRWAAWALAAVVTVVSLAPPLVGIVLEAAMGSSTVDKLIPEGARDSSSVADRGIQLLSAIEVVRRAPILGGGMGSEIAWEGVVRGEVSQAYVDNGWAYLLVKMGIAGSLAFAWFIVELVRRMRHGSVRLTTLLLSMLLLVMFTEPVFFQFTYSPFLGAAAGLLFQDTTDRTTLIVQS